MENATLTSKLLFHWVTPLMEKGVQGLLNHTDDLFDLPESISTNAITQEIDKHSKVPVSSKISFYSVIVVFIVVRSL